MALSMNSESMAKVEIHKAQVHTTLFSLLSLPVNLFFPFFGLCWQTSPSSIAHSTFFFFLLLLLKRDFKKPANSLSENRNLLERRLMMSLLYTSRAIPRVPV